MKTKLNFDTTSATTILDADSVGAWMRASSTGTLITHSSVNPATAKLTFDFVDGDVTVGADTIDETAHGLETGDKIRLTTSGTLPAGLAVLTDYFVIRVDADTISLAADLADAEDGTAIDITAAAGGGTHTLTEVDNERKAVDTRVAKTVLQQIEDAPHASGDVGTMALAVRNDSEGTLADADGDYAPLQVDSSGRLRVIADVDVTNLSEKAEDSAHTTADIGDYVLSVRVDDISAGNAAFLAGTEGDYQSFLTNAKGEQYIVATDTDALLTTIDAVLDTIKTDTGTIASDTTSIDATLTALSKAEDSVHGSGDQGIMSLAVRNDARTALAADADYIPLITNGVGELFVHDTDVLAELTGLTHNEDSVHVSGDKGVQTLAVRNDTLDALAGSDGDYAPLQVTSSGGLYVNDVANATIASSQETVTSATGALLSSTLSNRKKVYIQNEGNQKIYIGPPGVTTGNGFRINPFDALELNLGESVAIHAVAIGGSHTVSTLQIA